MRRGVTIFALGAAAGIACTTALSGGSVVSVVGHGAARVAGTVVGVQPAAADELPAFDDCPQLRSWYSRAAARQVGPWGLDGGGDVAVPMPMAESNASAAGRSAAAAPAPDAVGSSATGTNVQEAGVDEADVAKTDGRLLVRLSGRQLVVTDVSGDQPRELSRTTLPAMLTGSELLLDGDRVTVVGSRAVVPFPHPGFAPDTVTPERGSLPDSGAMPTPRPLPSLVPWGPARTRIVSVDIADPSQPRVTSDRSVAGEVLETRDYADSTVRVVLRSPVPRMRFLQPGDGVSERAATRRNREVVRDAPLGAWLPDLGKRADGRPVLTCEDVRHPRLPSGVGTVTVLSFDSDTPRSVDATAVATGGDLVYSSADRLYVVTTHGSTSTVHAFALEGADTSYVASGKLPGTVRDRWSMSEYDGHLRVATAIGPDAWQPADNAVVVLDQRGGRLVQTGRVDGIGRGEQIKAVRWLGQLAVLVTFRQTDPVFTVDLSDPARPRLRGKLEIPGFSAYLHPVGDGLLVGLGRDATRRGSDLGAQAATFDVSDLTAPRRVATLAFGPNTMLGAESDPHQVAYLPVERTLVTSLTQWTGHGGSKFVALHVGADGSLSESASWPSSLTPTFSEWPRTVESPRALPLGGGRVALVDDQVRIVEVG